MFPLEMVLIPLCKSICYLMFKHVGTAPPENLGFVPILVLVTFGRGLPVDKLLDMTQQATTLATTS